MKTINKLIKELTLVNFLFKIKTVLRKFSNTVEDEFEKVDDRIFIVEERVTVNEGDISNIKDKNLEQDNKIIAIEDNITDINEGIRDLDSRVEILEDKVAVVYTPKGSVANIDALFALTNQQIGWVYNLSDTGMNYVWLGGNEGDQGNGWDSLGGWVDFSEYYTRLEIDAKIDGIDLQRVTDHGNITTNDIRIISQNEERLAVLDSDDIILSDLSNGKNTTLSNAGGNTILEHSDNGITNGLSINKDKTVFTKVVQGVEGIGENDFVTKKQLEDLTKDCVPYTGADKPIDINTQSFSVNGLLEKNMLTFDKSRLAPNGNSHFVRLNNVTAYPNPNNTSFPEDTIMITIPIRTSVKWSMDLVIHGFYMSSTCSLNISAVSTNNGRPSVSTIYGDDTIITSVGFGRFSNNTVVLLRLNSNVEKSWLKVNVETFYHSGYENVFLSDKSLYTVDPVNEEDLTELTINSTINNEDFYSSKILYSLDGRIFYSKRFDADTVPEDARSNTFVGLNAGIDSGYGTDNIAIGTRALNGNGDFSIYNCIAIGHETLREYQLQDSLAIGYRALNRTTTGNRNVAIGNSALLVNETGGFNTALGFHALWSNLIGNNNVAIGYNALAGVKANNNTALGFRAGDGINNGSNNIAIGTTCMIGATSQNVSNIIAIGNGIKPQSGTDINEIIIGHSLTGKGSNTVLIGNTSIEKTYLNGTVDAPKFKVSSLNTPPLTSTDLGEVGEIRITATHIYVCVASNNWVRTELQTWT